MSQYKGWQLQTTLLVLVITQQHLHFSKSIN